MIITIKFYFIIVLLEINLAIYNYHLRQMKARYLSMINAALKKATLSEVELEQSKVMIESDECSHP